MLLFEGIAGRSVRALTQIVRAKDSPHSSIILSPAEAGSESFFYLEEREILGEAGKRVHADILMLMPERVYSDNNVYFNGTLDAGTCSVSANIAADYGLDIGSDVRIAGTDKRFTVSRIITAQAGIDRDYNREGIIIISYEEELLEKKFLFMSFDTDGGGYLFVDDIIFMNEVKKENVGLLIRYGIIAAAVMALSAIACEKFIFSQHFRRFEDYAILVSLGERKTALYLRALTDNLLKYIVPAALVCLRYYYKYSCYGAIYTDVAACFILTCLIAAVIYSFFIVRGICLCQVRTKRS